MALLAEGGILDAVVMAILDARCRIKKLSCVWPSWDQDDILMQSSFMVGPGVCECNRNWFAFKPGVYCAVQQKIVQLYSHPFKVHNNI